MGSKARKYGIDRTGKLVAIDLGGFVTTKDVIDEMKEQGDYQSDDSFLARFHLHLRETKRDDLPFPSIHRFKAFPAPKELTPSTNVQFSVLANVFPSERAIPISWDINLAG